MDNIAWRLGVDHPLRVTWCPGATWSIVVYEDIADNTDGWQLEMDVSGPLDLNDSSRGRPGMRGTSPVAFGPRAGPHRVHRVPWTPRADGEPDWPAAS
jgi:hypothetical protein